MGLLNRIFGKKNKQKSGVNVESLENDINASFEKDLKAGKSEEKILENIKDKIDSFAENINDKLVAKYSNS